MIFPLLLSLFLPLKAEALPHTGISTDSLTVYIFLLDECVISQYYTPLLNEYHDRYAGKKIGFVGYFPNVMSTKERISGFGEKYKITFPLHEDHSKLWTRRFGITITPEVAVWDHRDEKLIYRGRIDDNYVRVGKRKLRPQNHDLKDMVEAWLSGHLPAEPVITQPIGCFVNFGDQ